MNLLDRYKSSFLLTCLMVLASLTSAFASPATKQPDYVLIINSYTESTPWSRVFTTPIYERMITDNDSINAYTEHMDVMLMKTEEDVNAFIDELSEKYREKPPVMVVLLGNSSYVLLRDELARRWGDEIPLLFCVEKDYICPSSYYLSKQACPVDERIQLGDIVKSRKNLTVVYVPEYISETISLMKRCLPDMNRLLFLVDKQYISAQNQSTLENVMQTFPEVKLEALTAGEMQTDELIDVLQNSGPNTGILYYSWTLMKTRGRNTMLSSDTYRMLSSCTNLPIFTLDDMDIVKNGMIGGYYYPKAKISSLLFKTIDELLKGKIYDAVIMPDGPYPVLNYPVLERLDIPLEACPADTVFYMKPPTFWEQYGTYVYAGGTVLIFLLLILIFRILSLSAKREFQEKELKLMSSYSRLVKNMPICYMKQRVIFGPDGTPVDYIIKDINPEFEMRLGTNALFVGKKGSELPNQQFGQYLNVCNLVLGQNKKVSTQYYIESADRYFSVMIISASEQDCVDLFMVDTSELFKAQQLLRTVNKKLSMSLDVANVIPWKWDLERKTILCDVSREANLSASDLFDENQLSVPEADYFSKIFKSDRKKVREAYQSLIAGTIDKVREEYRVYNPEKGVHGFDWVEARATIDKRDEEGHPLSLIGSSLIITDRKAIERELIDAKNKAEESNRLKSAFLANMSHEIRTPLNAIVGFSNVLATTDEQDEKEEYISIIEINNALLLQLISDILDLSKIEAGTLEFVYSDVDINNLLYEFERMMQPRAAKDVKVQFEQRAEECYVSVPKNRLMQVLTNLTTNAIKFTTEGSIRFGYTRERDNLLRFYVTDTGCGIAEDMQAKIFERFVKLNAFAQGTGLGLSICQMIINHLGGELGVESKEGKGTTFWFTFPCSAANKPEKHQHQFEKKKVEKDRLTVLIAEDNVGNFKLFESILKHEYTLLHAWNGKEAVELFKEFGPHIILMDINMPEMNGYEATAEIRKISADVPIIAVTAYAFASDEQRIMNCGFDAYTSKPLNAPALKRQMGDLLSKRLFFV